MNVGLIITKRCNLRCSMCNIGKNIHKGKDELTIKDLQQSLDIKLKGISISGGEPFLRDDLTEIVNTLPVNKLFINTNGTLQERILNLINNTEKEIGFGISIDGLEHTHNLQRGYDVYKKTTNTIEMLKSRNKLVNISFTITPSNIQDITEVYKLSHTLNTGFSMRHAHNSAYYECDSNKFTPTDIQQLKKELKKLKEVWKESYLSSLFTFNIPNYLEGKTNIPKCYQLEDSVHISPTGDVYPCPALENISLGNIKQQKLSEILVSDNFLTMKGKIKNLQCPKCWNDCALLNNFNHIYYRRMLKYPFKISQTIIPPRILNNMVYHER